MEVEELGQQLLQPPAEAAGTGGIGILEGVRDLLQQGASGQLQLFLDGGLVGGDRLLRSGRGEGPTVGAEGDLPHLRELQQEAMQPLRHLAVALVVVLEVL